MNDLTLNKICTDLVEIYSVDKKKIIETMLERWFSKLLNLEGCIVDELEEDSEGICFVLKLPFESLAHTLFLDKLAKECLESMSFEDCCYDNKYDCMSFTIRVKKKKIITDFKVNYVSLDKIGE